MKGCFIFAPSKSNNMNSIKEELRTNEIKLQSDISIQMVAALMKGSKWSYGGSVNDIRRANQAYRANYVKVRGEVLATVPWEIRPHVLYRINKYYQHLL